MKFITYPIYVLSFLFLFIFKSEAQTLTNYYYYEDHQVPIQVEGDRLLVQFNADLTTIQKEEILEKYTKLDIEEFIDVPKPQVSFVYLNVRLTEKDMAMVLSQLEKDSNTNPYLKLLLNFI